MLSKSAENSVIWTDFGGRGSMQQHLADLAAEKQWLDLINRAKWLNFTNPQAAYAWRQLELQQLYLMNRAHFLGTSAGTGYTTPDQYISYLQKEYTAYRQENSALLQRAQLYGDNAHAMLAYAAALRGASESFGALSSATSAADAMSAALGNVPEQVITKMSIDDTAAIAQLAAYNALLRGVPREVSSTEVLTAAYAMGGVPLEKPKPEEIPVSYTGPYAEQYDRILAEVAALSRLRAEIPVTFDITDPAAVAAFVAGLRKYDVTEPVHLAVTGGAAQTTAGPPPDAVAQWNELTTSEKNAATEADAAVVKFRALQAALAGDTETASKLAYVYSSLSKSEQDIGAGTSAAVTGLKDTAAAATAAGGAVGFLQQKFTLFGGAFGKLPIIGAVSGLVLVLHLAVEASLVLIPALVALGAGLALVAGWAATAADAATRVYEKFTALNDVSSAFGQNLPPITDALHNMEAAARPQVYTLLGLALNTAGKYAGSFGGVLNKVGNDIVTFAIKAVDWFEKNQKAIMNFVAVGVADLKTFGNILLNIGRAFEPLIKAGSITHVAEIMLMALATAIGYVTEALKALPTWALVLGILGHSIATYGGLAVQALQGVLRSVAMVTANIPGLGRFGATLASTLGATNDQLVKLKTLTPELEQVSKGIAAGDASALALAKNLGLTNDQLVQVVAKDPQIKQVAASFGTTAENVARTQISLVATGTSAEEMAAKSGLATESMKADLASIKAESGDVAANMASLGVVTVGSAAKAEEGLAAYKGTVAAAGTATEGAAADATLLGKAMAGAGAAISGVAGFLAANWLLVAAAAAAAAIYLAHSFDQVTQSTKNYLASAQKALSTDTASQGLLDAAKQLGQMQDQINSYSKQIKQAGGFWSQFVANLKSGGNTIAFIMKSMNISQMSNSIQALTRQQKQDLTDVGNAATTMGMLMTKYGFSSAQALGIMDQAGVHLSDSLTIQEQKVQDLVAGYNMMAIKGGILYNSVNAVTFATEQQQSAISNITSGWSAFFQLVSTAPSNFLSLQSDMNTLATDANTAGASFTGLNAASITLQQGFITAVSGAQALANSLMDQVSVGMQGVKGTNLLSQAVKDMVDQLLPAASHSKTLTTILYALAQQGGYQGADSFEKLSEWVNTGAAAMKKAGGPAQNLQQLIQQAAGSVGNLGTDINNLDDAVNTQLVAAMTNAKLAMSPGLTGALEKVGTDIHNVKGQLGQGFSFPPMLLTDAGKLARILEGITGDKTQAEQLFETWAVDMGLTVPQAKQLWADVTGASNATDTASKKAGALKGEWGLVQNAAAAAAGHVTGISTATDKANAKASTLGGTWDQLVSNVEQLPHDIEVSFKSVSGAFNVSGITSGITGAFKVAFGLVEGAWKLVIATFVNSLDLFLNVLEGHWGAAWQNIKNIGLAAWHDLIQPLWNVFYQGAVKPIENWLTRTIPSDFTAIGKQWAGVAKTAWDNFNTHVVQPVGGWLNKTLIAGIIQFGKQWLSNAKTAWDNFNTHVVQPVGGWLNKTLIAGIIQFGQQWLSNAKTAWDNFNTHVVQPVGSWLNKTLIAGIIQFGQQWLSNAKTAWDNFNTHVVQPFTGWIKNIPGEFASAWKTVWDDFNTYVWKKLSGFFTGSLPGWISHIGSDIAKAFGFARGGVVPGYAPGQDTQLARLSPGEGVLVPEAVRGIGGPEVIYWLNRKFAGYRGAGYPDGQQGRFATGGVAAADASIDKTAASLIAQVASSMQGILTPLGVYLVTQQASAAKDILPVPNTSTFTGGVAGDAGRYGVQDADKFIAKEEAKAKAAAAAAASGGSAGPGGGTPAQNQALARSLMPSWASGAEWTAWLDLWNRESGWCVPLRVKIFTRRGWLSHDEVRPGDETIGYNPETKRSEWTVITGVVHFADQEVWRFGNKYWSVECTPGHRWLAERMDQAGKHVLAEELVELRARKRAHRVILARPADLGSSLPVTVNEAALLGWVAGDGTVHEPRSYLYQRKQVPLQELSPEAPYGYRRDGVPKKNRSGRPRSAGRRRVVSPAGMVIYQSKAEHFGAIEAALADAPSVSVLDIPGRRPGWQPQRTWRVSAAYSRDLIARAGHPKRDAVAQVLAMSPEQREAWLDAIIRAEGSRSGGKLVIYQDDGPVADAIELALYLSGRRTRRTKDSRGEGCSWVIGAVQPGIGGPGRRSFMEPAGRQDVWCVTTGLGTWTAEQDGKVFLTGNSQYAMNPSSGAYGIPQALPYTKMPKAAWPASAGGSSNPHAQETWGIGYIQCMPLDTSILTRRGWLSHAEVRPGDETVGFDPGTGMSRWTRITHVHRYENAPVVRMSGQRFRVRSTPNHRWLTEKLIQGNPNYRRFEFTQTASVGTRHRIRVAARHEDPEGLPISPGEAEILGWLAGDGHIADYRTRRTSDTDLGSRILAAWHRAPGASYREIGREVGCAHQTVAAYLRSHEIGSGHWRAGSGSLREIRITQAKPEMVARIDALLASEGVPFSRHVYAPKGISKLPQVLYQLGKSYSDELLKRSGYCDGLEAMVLAMSSVQRESFLAGLLGADGCRCPREDGSFTWILAQNEGPVLDAAVLAAYLSGHYSVPRDSAGQKHLTLGRPFIKGGAPLEFCGEQPVFCVTTELGSWTARQDGQVFLTGNSRYGDPIGAWAHELAYNWYALGGVVGGNGASMVPAFADGGVVPGFAAGGTAWKYPAPGGLHALDVTSTGYRLAWNAVRGPKGQIPSSYTVATYQTNGVEVDQFDTHPGSTSTAEYGRGGHGLHPGWTYHSNVWANGGPLAPPHATVSVTLRAAPATGTGTGTSTGTGFSTGTGTGTGFSASTGTGTSTGTSTSTGTATPPPYSGPIITSGPAPGPPGAAIFGPVPNLEAYATLGGPGMPVQPGGLPGGVPLIPSGPAVPSQFMQPVPSPVPQFVPPPGAVVSVQAPAAGVSSSAGTGTSTGTGTGTGAGTGTGTGAGHGHHHRRWPYLWSDWPGGAHPLTGLDGLGQVAGMFSPGVVPGFRLLPRYVLPPATVSPATGLPRSVSDAAAASGGQRIGLQIQGDLNVHNPVPEKVSESITRSSNKLAFLAGRGIV